MFEKHPCWTRTRAGRNRVHWVAYDDRPEAEVRSIIDQGYATSLTEADAQARAALAEAGMYQARRLSKSARPPRPPDSSAETIRARPAPTSSRPREYLFTRRQEERDDRPLVAAHLILRKTPRKVYVTRNSIGPDQLATTEETWGLDDRAIALDRTRLETEGAAYSGSHRQSDFYTTRAAAMGETPLGFPDPARTLGLRSPFTTDEIKAAYRRLAFEVHPDRGGDPERFQVVEAAYRHLIREAQTAEP